MALPQNMLQKIHNLVLGLEHVYDEKIIDNAGAEGKESWTFFLNFITTEGLYLFVAVAVFFTLRRLWRAILTFRGTAYTPNAARFASRFLRSYTFNSYDFYRSDGCTEEIAAKREAGLEQLSKTFSVKYGKSTSASVSLLDGLSDLRFTDTNRVPFPFQKLVREKLNVCSLVDETKDCHVKDIDGNWSIDISGSYGVTVACTEVYKQCLSNGLEKIKDLGLVLGPLHPVIGDVLPALKRISGKEEVSFHMSGTEAVMCAVRLAAFNTRRHLTVVFNGAYHGWWDGVQPGVGNERRHMDILNLKDMSPAALAVIKARAHEIACVLVNPVQGFNPNAPPPNDLVMMNSNIRKVQSSEDAYRTWLHNLRDTCTDADVPLIFDEVYSGFRMSPGGAQQYYDVHADMVVYGKTLGGGMPVGVVCGPSKLMQRFDSVRPMRVAYVIGTFSAHPLTLAAMAEFLAWVEKPETAQLYNTFNNRFNEWIIDTNIILKKEGLPIQLANLTSVFTILFTQAGRYNWMLQYYMRAEDISMAWVGTGRLLASVNFTDGDLAELRGKIIAAAKAMQHDGWLWSGASNTQITKRMAGEVLRNSAISMVRESVLSDVLALPEDYDPAAQRRDAPRNLTNFYKEIMQRKEDDHHASHSNTVNQFLHIVSSSMFIYCYFIVFSDRCSAMWIGLISLTLRQTGHAILEPPCHSAEELLLGFNTRAKCFVFSTYVVSGVLLIYKMLAATGFTFAGVREGMLWGPVADTWLGITTFFILGHVAILTLQYGFVLSMVWFVKFVTDPFTDLPSYRRSVIDVFTTKDWQTASLATLKGHLGKETAPKKKFVTINENKNCVAPVK